MSAITLRGLLRDPLTHFLGAGLVVFAVHHGMAADDQRQVTLTPERVAALAAAHEARTGEAVDADTRAALIRGHVRGEVLFREGLALGLDRGDPVVRRRVIQKMEYLLGSVAPPEPEEADLRELLARDPARYARPSTHDLDHVFVGHRDDGQAEARARELLQLVNAGQDPTTLGEAFPHGASFRRVPTNVTARRFGEEFAVALAEAPVGPWLVAPSDHGWHVVRVRARTEGSVPALSEIREQVRADWIEAWQQREASRQEAELLERYRVETPAS